MPHTDKVGKLTRAQAEEIAKAKMPDLTAADLDAAVRTIAGSARQHGHHRGGREMNQWPQNSPSARRRLAARSTATRLIRSIDAMKLVKETATAKFDESIDVAVNLGIDAKKSDQTVRGSVVLPAGTGKKVRVAVFAQGDKAEAAKAAGADIVGMEDLAAADQGRQAWISTCVIASPGHHARRRPAGPDTRPARPDAEPEGRHGDAGCGHCGEKRQGGPGAVPRRQGRHRAMHDRPRFVRARGAVREPEGADGSAEQGQARGEQGRFTCRRCRCPAPWAPGVRVDVASVNG